MRLRFLEKEPYAPSGSKTVPVLEDKGNWIADSWAIACYLETAYPDRPTLFGGAIGQAEARFVNLWIDSAVTRTMFPMYAADVWDCLDEPDRSYFRETREQRIGCSLEDAREGREAMLEPLAKALTPLRSMLGEQAFICGEAPAYADYCAFTPFLWAHCASRFECLAAEAQSGRHRQSATQALHLVRPLVYQAPSQSGNGRLPGRRDAEPAGRPAARIDPGEGA